MFVRGCASMTLLAAVSGSAGEVEAFNNLAMMLESEGSELFANLMLGIVLALLQVNAAGPRHHVLAHGRARPAWA
jgi:hypothetical protein